MALTISVVDNADGSGAVATIAGSDPAQTVTVWTSRVDLAVGGPAWTSSGSRSGNGTVALALTPGYFFAYASGTVGAVPANSVPTYFPVTRSSQSVLDRLLDAVVAKLQTLSFPAVGSYLGGALPAGRIIRRDAFNEAVLVTLPVRPCVCVSAGVAVNFTGGTNLRDDVGLPVAVVLLDNSSPQLQANFPTYELWHERISRGLRNQRVPGIVEIYNLFPESYRPLQWSGPEGVAGYDICFAVISFRAVSREPRGV